MSTDPLLHARAVLTEHDLPPGLLPGNVDSTRFDPTSGRLEVTLRETVSTKPDGIPVRYATTVKARVKQGAIDELEGVEARFALWLRVAAIRRDGEKLAFEVGRITKRLPEASFR